MTENQLEKIAEFIFRKLLAAQEQWEQQFYQKNDYDQLLSEIIRLNLVKADHITNENYEAAAIVQREINKTRELIKNIQLG